ncbi:hypothetical protein BGZ74_002471 [Mortierella antarctica]|nr:hypothetical protein BGZ74_002471 [Mortierella antarctica]
MKPSTVSTVLVLATAIALANAKAIDKRDDTLADYAAVEQQEGVATLLKRLVDTTIGATEAPQTEDLIIVPDTTLFEEKTVSQRIKKAEGDESDDDEDYDEDEGEDEESEDEANGVDVFVVDFNSNFCDTISADSVMTVEEATAQQTAIMEANAMAEAEEAKEDEADSDDEDEDEGEDEDYEDEEDEDEGEDEDYNDGEDEGEGEVEAQAVVLEIVAEASEIPEVITLDATKEATAEVTVEKPAAQEKRHHHHRE